jgi:hypothetical protein
MIIYLLVIPILVIFVALYLYQHTGKKEFFKLDVIQLFYTFVVAPMVYVWLKTFIFLMLQENLINGIGYKQFFIYDTIFSLVLIFLYALVVMHSLTKTFAIQKNKDELYDIFEHSEFFHLSFSHVGIYIGLVIVFLIFGILNAFFPLPFSNFLLFELVIIIVGCGLGLVNYLLQYGYKCYSSLFYKLMKMIVGMWVSTMIGSYFLMEIPFSIDYSIYWIVTFASLVNFILILFKGLIKKKNL